MALNDNGIKLPPKPKAAESKEPAIPVFFSKALAKNKKAKTMFDTFSPGKRKEYIAWLAEAKTEDTRNKRMQNAMEWISEGKSRNWKYGNK